MIKHFKSILFYNKHKLEKIEFLEKSISLSYSIFQTSHHARLSFWFDRSRLASHHTIPAN